MIKQMTYSLLVAMSLSACQYVQNFEDVHKMPEPIVTPTQTRIFVQFGNASSMIESDERKAIEDFIMRHDVSAQDEITIEIKAQGGDLADERAEKISAYLKHLGLKPRYKLDESLQVAHNIGVTLTRYQVAVPNCPNWSKNPAYDHNNQLSSNFGCAQATNLALMIGDPKDLLIGQWSAPNGYVLSNAIRTYEVPRGGWSDKTATETTHAFGSKSE